MTLTDREGIPASAPALMRRPGTVNEGCVTVVDSHTAGMPTRVVTAGIPPIPGDTMAQRRAWGSAHLKDTLGLLMREPRGHPAMFGALIQSSTRDDADIGMLYFDAADLIPMCGHGTIGAVTVLIETGVIAAECPGAEVRLDTAAGLVSTRAQVADGKVTSVTLTNVPAYVLAHSATVEVPAVGQVRYDLVWGGNLYAIVRAEDAGLQIDGDHTKQMLAVGLETIDAINREAAPTHPTDPSIRGIHSMMWVTTNTDAADSRIATINLPGYIDRSPCGTGTSALMALRHSSGDLGLNQPYLNESPVGTTFEGRLVSETTVNGYPAVVPTITGEAWITGYNQRVLDPTDPFPQGFAL
jgi:proline racemase